MEKAPNLRSKHEAKPIIIEIQVLDSKNVPKI
jgi:protocatechuate 3,4-dioxygenase beta subunit